MTAGFMILMLCHAFAGALIFALGFGVGRVAGSYSFFAIWVVGYMGFLFWQMLYAIPLIICFRRRGELARMKGVLFGAVLTALVNGACFLYFYGPAMM
ncbi:MAG TPA: hypothetical protein V6D02_15285 [Candidatus Obscuribacterales bacterium]